MHEDEVPKEPTPEVVTIKPARIQFPRRLILIRMNLVILSVALVSLVVAVSVYRWQFGSALSTSTDEWARFGEYLGGMLSPLFSLFALVGVLWAVRQTQLQQFDTTFFNLVQRLGQVREGEVSRSTPGVVPNIYTGTRSHQVPMQLLVREAWEKLIRQINIKPEATEVEAHRHLLKLLPLLRKEFGDVFRLTDKILQLYRFIDRAPISAGTTSYYVEIVNSEITPIEQSLLLFALVSQPVDGAACRVVNDLKAFISLGLDIGGVPPAYRKVLHRYFPHLPKSADDRPMLAV